MSSKVTKSIPLVEPQHSDLQTENLQLLAEPIAEETLTQTDADSIDESDDDAIAERHERVGGS